MSIKNKKAFTLIELLVVVLIIGILAAVALPQYKRATQKAKAAQAYAIGKTLLSAEQVYKNMHSVYTEVIENLDVGYKYTASSVETCCGTGKTYTGINEFTVALRAEGSAHHALVDFTLKYQIRFHANNTIDCLAWTGNNDANKLCQSLGGKLLGRHESWQKYQL